eukprot:g62053.t1
MHYFFMQLYLISHQRHLYSSFPLRKNEGRTDRKTSARKPSYGDRKTSCKTKVQLLHLVRPVCGRLCAFPVFTINWYATANFDTFSKNEEALLLDAFRHLATMFGIRKNQSLESVTQECFSAH